MYAYLCSDKRKNIYVSLDTIWLYLMQESIGMTSWMDLELHSYDEAELKYMLCRFPTGILLLVNIRYFSHCSYTSRVQPYLYGNKLSDWWSLFALFMDLQYVNYIMWTFNKSIYLKSMMMSNYGWFMHTNTLYASV